MNAIGNFAYLFSAAVLLMGGLAFAVCIFIYLRTKAKIAAIESTPTSVLGDLDEGYHKSSGEIVAREKPLVSPLSQTECVYYLFTVEELKTTTKQERLSKHERRRGKMANSKTESHWENVITDKKAVKCALKDETGEAEVKLLDAETVLSPNAHSTSGTFNNCSEELRQTLSERYNFSTRGLLFNKTLRYTETLIEEGNTLFVIGNIEKKGGDIEFVRGKKPFIVSDQCESDVVKSFRLRATLCLAFAAMVSLMAPAVAAVPHFILPADFASLAERIERKKDQEGLKPLAGGTSSENGSNGGSSTSTGAGAQTDPASDNTQVVKPIPDPVRNTTTPIAKNQGPGPVPKASSPIDKAIVDLRSTDPIVRLGGAAYLLKAKPDMAHKDEVVKALKAVAEDEDVNARIIAGRALETWEKYEGPASTGPEVSTFVQEGKYYRIDPKRQISFAVSVDPAPKLAGAATESWNTFPVQFMGKRTIYPPQPSPFTALTPRVPKGQKDDGSMQIVDLRTGRTMGRPFPIKFGMGEPVVLAATGDYIAARVPGRETPNTIEVIDTNAGQVLRRIEAGQGTQTAQPIGFVGKDKLLTQTQTNSASGGRNDFKVWNVRTGEVLSEFAFDFTYSGGTSCLSGGGRYILFYIGAMQRLVIFDLGTGKVAGDIEWKATNDGFAPTGGLAFSPDGKEFAVLSRIGKKDVWAKIFVFDATTGRKLAAHDLNDLLPYDGAFFGNGGLDNIQWLPDGSGWLIFGSLVIDRKSGKQISQVGSEKKSASRRFVGVDRVTGFKGGLDPAMTLEVVKYDR